MPSLLAALHRAPGVEEAPWIPREDYCSEMYCCGCYLTEVPRCEDASLRDRLRGVAVSQCSSHAQCQC